MSSSFVGLWFFCAIIATMIGSRKGEAGSAFLFGLILGPLGVILALLSTGSRKKCQFCREYVDKKATVCPRCQKENPIPLK